MNLFEKIEDILDNDEFILPKKEKIKIDKTFDENLFNNLADFIINLNPDLLDESQIDKIIDLIDEIEVDDISELGSPKLSRRTNSQKNQYSKKWYRKNRTEIKRRKAKLKRSSEGRKRIKEKDRLASQGRTSTGRRKVRYHIRKRSDRRDRDANLSQNR